MDAEMVVTGKHNGPAVTVTQSTSKIMDQMSLWLDDRSTGYQHIILDVIIEQITVEHRVAWHIEDDHNRLLFCIVFADYIRTGPAVKNYE